MMNETTPVALVTGASRGLGRGIATRLASLGFSVAVNFVNSKSAADETVALCKKSQKDDRQKFIPMKANMGIREDRAALLDRTLNEFGRVDTFISNAGIGPRVRADITETSLESFEEVLRVNLEAPFFLTQLIVNYWLKEKPAHLLANGFTVVFNSSISANTASVNRAEYCISKAGLAMVSQLWAVRLAEENIRVYELRPGIMETDMTSSVKEKYDKLFAEGLVPQKRWGQPDDVGRAVGALVMGEFPYSTGEIIYIDGGLHLRRL